jgi:hypothetical protein
LNESFPPLHYPLYRRLLLAVSRSRLSLPWPIRYLNWWYLRRYSRPNHVGSSYAYLQYLEGASQLDSLTDEFLDKILVHNALVTVDYGDKTDTLRMVSPGIYASATPCKATTEPILYAFDPQTGEEDTAVGNAAGSTVRVGGARRGVCDGDVEVDVATPSVMIRRCSNWYLVNFYKKVS